MTVLSFADFFDRDISGNGHKVDYIAELIFQRPARRAVDAVVRPDSELFSRFFQLAYIMFAKCRVDYGTPFTVR